MLVFSKFDFRSRSCEFDLDLQCVRKRINLGPAGHRLNIGFCIYKDNYNCLRERSGRVLDSRPRDARFEPHRRHFIVSLSKTHLS